MAFESIALDGKLISDEKIAATVNRLQTTFDDKSPFMLLPLKLEARFMERKHHIFEGALSNTSLSVATALNSAAKIGFDLAQKGNYTDHTILSASDDMMAALQSGNNYESYQLDNTLEKAILIEHALHLSLAVSQFKNTATSYSFSNSENETVLASKLLLLDGAMEDIEDKIEGLALTHENIETIASQEGIVTRNNIFNGISSADSISFSAPGDISAHAVDIQNLIDNFEGTSNSFKRTGKLGTIDKYIIKESIIAGEGAIAALLARLTAAVPEDTNEENLQAQLLDDVAAIKVKFGLLGAASIVSDSLVGLITSERLKDRLSGISEGLTILISADDPEFSGDLKQFANSLSKNAAEAKTVAEHGYVASEDVDAIISLMQQIENKLPLFVSLTDQSSQRVYTIGDNDKFSLDEIISSINSALTYAQLKAEEPVANEEAQLLYMISHASGGTTYNEGDNWDINPDREIELLSTNLPSLATVIGSYTYSYELWVRIYPDDIFVHSHEEAVTQGEMDDAKAFWNEWWAAKGDSGLQLGAWRALEATYGAERSAYLIRAFEPTNLGAYENSNATVLIKDLDNVNSFIESLSNVDLKKVDKPESYFALLNEKVSTINRFAAANTTPSEYQKFKLEVAVSNAKSKLDELQKSLNKSGNKNLSSLQAQTQKNIGTLIGTISGSAPTAQAYGNSSPVFPNWPSENIKDTSWTEAPRAYVLPDYFVALAINDGSDNSNTEYAHDFKYVVAGKDITQGLQLGINPNAASNAFRHDTLGNLIVDPGIKWMVDYNQALLDGMAITITVDKADYDKGFDKLLVLGARTKNLNNSELPDAVGVKNGSKNLIKQLLRNHQYAAEGGMSIIRQGTPTNNTDSKDAGFHNEPSSQETSFTNYASDPLYVPVADDSPNVFNIDKTDGQWLAEALGLENDFFKHLPNANLTQVGNSLAMNRALWSGTLGYYMEEMFDTAVSMDTVNRTRDFFTNFVLARGIVPSIRVGNQPYGILPVTAIHRIENPDTETIYNNLHVHVKTAIDSGQFDSLAALSYLSTSSQRGTNFPHGYTLLTVPQDRHYLSEYLNRTFKTKRNYLTTTFYKEWRKIANLKVDFIGKDNGGDPQAMFMNILGLHATAEEYYHRYAVNISPSYLNIPEENNQYSYFSDTNISRQSLITLKNKQKRLKDQLKALISFNDASTFNNIFAKPFWTGDFVMPTNDLDSVRMFEMRYIQEHFQLNGPEVTEKAKKLSEEKKLAEYFTATSSQEYIRWMQSAPTLADIFRGPADLDELPSRSLLFILLRQSYLLTYRTAVSDFLMNHFILLPEDRIALGAQESLMVTRFRSELMQNYANPTPINKWSLTLKPFLEVFENPMSNDYFFKNNIHDYVINYNRGVATHSFDTLIGPTISDPLSGKFTQNPVLGEVIRKPGTNGGLDSLVAQERFFPIQMEKALDNLQQASTAELQRLMTEHLDLCSYRLDAWLTGMVNERLFEGRKGWYADPLVAPTAPNSLSDGSYLGAYGWLTGVKRGPNKTLVNNSDVPSNLMETGKIYFNKDNQGYIHAPSIDHALAAAILRAGYISENDESDVNNRFAVNLSSERVRLALSILEGVQNGQELGALLGYIFERYLHEQGENGSLEMDQYIYPLRRRFPLVPQVSPDTTVQDPEITLNHVVNGVELLNAVRTKMANAIAGAEGKSLYEVLSVIPGNDLDAQNLYGLGSNIGLPNVGTLEMLAILAAIDRIANAIDAVGDVAMAEGVYQVVRGNFDRASAAMESLADGKKPMDPQVIKTPRTGTSITHRFLVQVPISTATATTPRSQIEPTINEWLASALPSMSEIKCLATYLDASQNPVEQTITADSLLLAPIDLLFFLDKTLPDAGSELEQRIAFLIKAASNDPITDLQISIKERGGNWNATDYTFYELMPQIEALSRIVKSGRPATAQDYVLPGETIAEINPHGYAVSELEQRLNTCLAQLSDLLTDLEAANFQLLSLTDQREKLLLAANFNVGNNLPADPSDTAQLDEKALAAHTILSERYNLVVASLGAPSTGMGAEEVVKRLLDCFSAIFGEEAIVYPQFTLANQTPIAAQLDSARQDTLVPPTNPFAMDQWLLSIARVRKSIESFENALLFSGQPGFKDTPIKPLQFPVTVDADGKDYWLGIEYPSTFKPSGDKLSLLLANSQAIADSGNKHVGIYVDAWTETIPDKEEVTGISFHYDQPNAKPPQNILLAVSPTVATNQQKGWHFSDLIYTLLDTLELAKVRCVEPSQLMADSATVTVAGENPSENGTFIVGILGHLLPAVIGEVAPPLFTEASLGPNEDYMNSLSNLTGTFDYGFNNAAPPTLRSVGQTYGGASITGVVTSRAPSVTQASNAHEHALTNLNQQAGRLQNEGVKVSASSLSSSISVKIKFDQND